MQENPLTAGLRPGPRWGSLQRSPSSPSRWETPLPQPWPLEPRSLPPQICLPKSVYVVN